FQRTASFFRPISADEGQSGPRPHIGLLDEIHEHRNAMVVEMMRAGTKSRDQALIFMITNSGSDRRGVCYDYHEYSEKVAAGQLEDDSFFGFVCGLDESDDPLNDEACWAKANPSLQEAGIPGLRYLREQVTQARGIPAKEALVKRLNFCVWTESSSPWITADVWLAAREATEIPWEAYYGRRCYGGLDLSSTQDLTSLVLLFEPDESDPYWRLKPWFWLPGDDLKRKEDLDRVPYTLWRSRGYLEALPGRAIDKLAILRRLLEISEVVDLAGLAYDRWRIQDLIMLAQAQGIELPPMTPFGQGFKEMAPALDVFEQLLLNEQLRHDGNPVMTWCASNAVTMSDPAGNRKVSKERARGRVDGIVASIMAAGMSAPMHSQREWSLLESLSDDDILVM
ncbi:terminase large subunit, partial [Paracandidimonas soli]